MAKKISASDIFQEEDIFLGIRQSAEKTILSFQEIDAEVKKLAGNLKKDLSTADFGNTKGINSFVAATQKANDAKNKSIQIDKVLAQATKDVAAADKALVDIEIKKQKLAQEQIKTNNAIAKSENDKAKATEKAAKAAINEASAYKQLEASTRVIKTQAKELLAQMLASEKAGKTNTAAYAALETQYKEVAAAVNIADAELKGIDKTVGDSFRNVGNYEQATKGLKQQLREMTVALQNMDSSDPRFRQMSIDAGNLKDTIMDTNAVIKSTAGSAVENLGNGIAKAGKVGIDAFAGMTGAMGLFGIESESAMAAMLKLQQLAAMSEALQSLGALGDTMTEIRASFVAAASKLGLFTTAKVVDTTVTTTQTVATEAATVATSGLGKAMKALPIVAIIAGIAALAYGIYSLVSGNEEAELATKKRAEAEKRANEESKKTIEFVSTESGEFSALIYQLKATNKNSEDRRKLIKEINGTYGTTLKNLSDETAFQSSLNDAVQDYIDLQYNRYKLQKNQIYIDQQTAKKFEAEVKINKARAEAQGLVDKGIYRGTQEALSNREDLRKIIEQEQKVINDANAALLKLGVRRGSLKGQEDELTEGGKKYIPILDKEVKSTKDLTNATDDQVKANEELKTSLTSLNAEYANRTKTAEQILLAEKDAADTELKRLHSISTDLLNRDQQLKAALILNDADYQAKLLALKENKDVTKAETKILDIQLKLKKAKGLEAVALEIQLQNAQLELLTEQEQAELLAVGNNEEAKNKIIAEYALKRADMEIEFADKSLKKEDEADTKALEQKAKNQKTEEDLVKGAADFFIAQSNKKIEQIDKEIAAANTQYTTLQTLAANGNINAKESLAEQQKIINEANAQKAKELKKQQRIKLAESVYSTYNAKVAANSEHPLLDTIKDTMLLQQFIASLPTFHDGTEDTGKNGNGIDGKGGFHAILHPNERVVPKSLNEQIGGLSNEALAKMANEYQNGKIIRSNSQIGSSFDTAILVGKIDELTNAIKMKPETNIGIGEITQSVMEIVKSTKQGNTTTYNRYKVRR